MIKKVLSIISLALVLLNSCSFGLSEEQEFLQGTQGTSTRAVSSPVSFMAENLGEGQIKYSITFDQSQAYVEVFARQFISAENRWLQNVAQIITNAGTVNTDGTITYTYTKGGYSESDTIQFRFYSYAPASPGVFTPGPDFSVWKDHTYSTFEDPSLITESGDYYFQMVWYNAAALSQISINSPKQNFLKEIGGYYPEVGDPIYLGYFEAGQKLTFSVESYWHEKWFGPVTSDNHRYFMITKDENNFTFLFEDAVGFDMGYNDGEFLIYKGK